MNDTEPAEGLRLLPERDKMVHRLSRAELNEVAKFYGRGLRQIRRWLAVGREKNDPCPVFAPQKLPSWWMRNMSQAVPNDIFILAVGVNGNCPPPGGIGDLPLRPTLAPAVDLKTIDLNEADSITQMSGLAQAVYQQLADAYQKRSSDIPLLQRRYEKALEALHKVQAAERQARRESGDLIPRWELERDATQLATMLREMRVSMARRVLELCPKLGASDREEVRSAIERVREQEDRIFTVLPTSPADLLAELVGA